MAQFLDTTAVSHELTQLIKKADEKLYLLSPYLQIAPTLKDLIKERDSRKIDIRFVYGKVDKLNQEDMSFLQELTSVKISFCENMHAKCYLNENTAIITSMNLYQYSQQNNREMGFKIDSEKDPDVFLEIKRYVDDIWGEGKPFQYEVKKIDKELPLQKKSYLTSNTTKSTPQQTGNTGFCIRCHNSMVINPNTPLCSTCYPIWAKFSNRSYREKYCHICGKESTQTINDPVCKSCSQKLKK
jgi:phosphatidylserine/phosphatidylglycerophosphate/cardiolipin synthase-like enzyme